MTAKRDKAYELMKTYCADNYNRFARELGVDPSHLHRFLTTGVGVDKFDLDEYFDLAEKIIFGKE
jgi:hypothetical protein